MRPTAKNISIVFLAFVYLAVACATTVSLVLMPYLYSGPELLERASGKTKDVPKLVWSQRRHMPLVKDISLSPLLPSPGNVPEDINEHVVIRTVDQPQLGLSFYFSSLSDRAPPLS